MRELLAVSRLIDSASRHIGRSVSWLIVVVAAISAGNAIIRKTFDISSNAWLELQWWLFALVFLLAAPWTLSQNEHVRIDIVNTRLAQPMRNAIELVGHVFFLLPTAAVIAITSWSYFLTSFTESEQSPNAGGLPQWPVKVLIPVAFALLFVQGLSELIKRVAIMRGLIPEPVTRAGYHEAVAAAAVPSAAETTSQAKRSPE